MGGSGHLGAPQADRVRRGRSAAKKLVGHGIGAPLGWVREPNSKRGVLFFVSGTVGMSGISVLKWVGLRISGFSGLSDIELV